MSRPVSIMQKDDERSPSFVLIDLPLQEAKEYAWRLSQKRNAKGWQWPKWKVNGFSY